VKIPVFSLLIIMAVSALMPAFDVMVDMPPGAIDDADWWGAVGEAALRGLANGGLSVLAVTAAAYGVDVRDQRRRYAGGGASGTGSNGTGGR
jgi:hypothetical protein